MTTEKFQLVSFAQLELLTGIDRYRWKQYLYGKVTITEKTLSRIAPKLDMTPGELLSAITQRREKK